MRVYMSGATAHLEGEWSVSGVTKDSLDTLSAALQQIDHTGGRRLQVDCRRVHALDTTGHQILTVWLQCARLRGVEPELVIPANNLQQTFKGLGIRCRYTSRNTLLHNHSASNHRKRRIRHENRRDQGNCQTTWH
jgi:anti-anti-sigma regulatory factor